MTAQTAQTAATTYPAISGTYAVIHRTTSAPGTAPRRVRAICGQATRQSYLSVITEEAAASYAETMDSRPCAKCHG